MFAETYDRETIWKMESALSRAFETLPPDVSSHATRAQVAAVIAKAVEGGERSAVRLTAVAKEAMLPLVAKVTAKAS